MGRLDDARHVWSQALFGLTPASKPRRRGVLRRLASLEEEQGQPGTALRHWRAILEMDPEDLEARERVANLTGVSP